MTAKTIIVGSGLSGLMLAKMLKKYRNPDADIVIIEREPTIGGQFSSLDYGAFGHFDYGMHIYYESCIPEIDELFTSLLPEAEWHILSGNYKDVAGVFVNGRLQTSCPYVDLRTLPEETRRRIVADLLLAIAKNAGTHAGPDASAHAVLTQHFGSVIANEVYAPVLQKLYLNDPSKLHELATKLTAIDRVALFDPAIMLDLMQSPAIRARICYPDQYTLPAYRTNNQRGFYPKQYGIFRVLEKFKRELEADGVEFMTATAITHLAIHDSRVDAVSFKNPATAGTLADVRDVYWTAGLPPLAAALNIDLSDLKNDKREPALYVNLVFDKKPTMGGLYYFYCFDKGYRTFRVTSYVNYCPAACEGRGYPVCVEVWPETGDSVDEAEVLGRAVAELKAFGVVDGSHHLQFGKVERVHGGGFPLPTINNLSNIDTVRDRIRGRGVSNLVPMGVLAEKNVFFIKDVLIDAYQKVTESRIAPRCE